MHTKRINELLKECIEIDENIKQQQESLQYKINEAKKLLPKGYWWTYYIDKSYDNPKKYSIKDVYLYCNNFYIKVKEFYKKAPYKGFTGEYGYSLDNFMKLEIYKTEEEAKSAYYNRICPKCGRIMKYANTVWCKECMEERDKKRTIFEKEHTFYNEKNNLIYTVGYVDELTRNSEKGYNGKHFTIQCLDTMEIIHTDNLWSSGIFGENIDNLPKIEFL